MRPIDADRLKRVMDYVREDNPHKVIGAMIDYFEEIVDCQPTVDAIPNGYCSVAEKAVEVKGNV